MESSAGPVPFESLLAHRDWVRRVARALVADESLADDLEQDLWSQALAKPPRIRDSIRGWIAATLRNGLVNRRRSEARRARRERAAARPEGQPSTEGVVALAQAHRLVVVEVLGLSEPYRSAVLLRYFEDLAPKAIAQVQAVPLETVRARLRRAREMLRERLDTRAGGDRGAWCAALLPLSLASIEGEAGTGGASIVGGLLVQTSTKIAVASLFVAAASLAGYYMIRPSSPSAPAGPFESTEARDGGHRADEGGEPTLARADAPPPLARETLGSGAVPTARVEAPGSAATGAASAGSGAEPALGGKAVGAALRVGSGAGAVKAGNRGPAGEVSGRLLWIADRTPLQGATVSLVAGDVPAGKNPPESRPVTTGYDGSFRLSSLSPGTWRLVASKDGFAAQGFAATLIEESGEEGIEILLAAAGSIEGRVTDARGDPTAGLALACEPARGISVGAAAPPTRTDAEGVYRFPALAAGNYVVILERAPGQSQRALASVVEGKTTRLDYAGGATLGGTLSDEARAPITDARVRAISAFGAYTSREATTDKAGRFRFDELQPGEWRIALQVLGPQGFSTELTTITAYPGENTLDLDLTRTDLQGEVLGRLRAAGTGAPLSSTQVQLTLHAMEAKDGAWRLGHTVHMAFADAQGRFRFRAIRPGRYRFTALALAGALRPREEEFDLTAGDKKDLRDVLLEPTKVGTVKFVVKDEAGAPLLNVAFATVRGSDVWTFEAGRPEPGTYTASLEVGAATVHLERAGLASAQVTVEVREDETVTLEVTLRPEPAAK
jgi:RNA polymerase sigma-70 factor (ECF subfamily)